MEDRLSHRHTGDWAVTINVRYDLTFDELRDLLLCERHRWPVLEELTSEEKRMLVDHWIRGQLRKQGLKCTLFHWEQLFITEQEYEESRREADALMRELYPVWHHLHSEQVASAEPAAG